MPGYNHESRVVMNLDAGGTNFWFSALRGNQPVTETLAISSHGDNLKKCLANIIVGFSQIKKQCPGPPVAIGACAFALQKLDNALR